MSNPTISRDLLGKIVDEVFDGAIEDASVIEEIYAAIKRHESLSPVPHVVGGITFSAETILAIRDALIGDSIEEAYHQLYKAIDPDFVKLKPWAEIEALSTAPQENVVGGEPTPSRPEASSTTTDALPLSYGSPRADLAYSAAASNHAVGSEERGIGIGMAIAAGIIMRSWGQEVYAREILGSAGLDTLEKLKASGVDQYDIDALMSVVATATEGSSE